MYHALLLHKQTAQEKHVFVGSMTSKPFILGQ
jgi:hypothetical protein